MKKPERVLIRRRANYWKQTKYEHVDLQTLAKRYLRGCKRSGLSLSEAVNVLRLVASAED